MNKTEHQEKVEALQLAAEILFDVEEMEIHSQIATRLTELNKETAIKIQKLINRERKGVTDHANKK